MQDYQKEFLKFVIDRNILRFGEFTLKSGRKSPYFFNAGLFNTGQALGFIGRCYAAAVQQSGLDYDVVFGPAYKGIPLASATSIALAQHHDRDAPYCFNRKEAKDHGEGGSTIGAPLEGRVLVIDDVMTAGTAVRESATILQAHDAQLAGVAISLDRMERGASELSAVQEVQERFGVPVISIATAEDLLSYLQSQPDMAQHLDAISEYRRHYGVMGYA